MDSLKCTLLLLAFFLSTAHTQMFHVVAPNTLRLDSKETIAIAVDDKPTALVNVYIQDHPGKIRNITQKVLQVNKGQPQVLDINLNPSDFPPDFFTTPNSEKLVSLTVHSDNFHKEVVIPVTNQAGYVFIQADKTIYTPKQRAQFRIIPLNEDGLPTDKPFKLQIKNPKNNVVQETSFNGHGQKARKVFVTHGFDFPNYPVLGEWSATVNYGHEMKQNATIHFELLEYVLPTFTVDLKTPEVILETDEVVTFSVNSQYVYGKKVRGSVTFRVGVKMDALPKATFFVVIGPKELNDGHLEQEISTREFKKHNNIGWFPEIEGSRLVVEATVVDAASGNKEVATDATGRFSKSPFEISFKRCLLDFKPGLLSVFEADINYVGGQPAGNVPVIVKATANGGHINVSRSLVVSDAEGKVGFNLHPQMHHSTISITLETDHPRYVGNQAVGHFIQNRFRSRNGNSFIAIERGSSHKQKLGESFMKTVYIEPPAMKDIYYAVISKGKIVRMDKLPEGDFKVQKLEFVLTHKMVPSFRLVVWAHYQDELLADSLNIQIEKACNPDAVVSITPEYNVKEPGNEGKIIIRGTKSTLVGLLGVDEAVYALSKNDLLTKEKVFKTMAKHDLGCGPGGGLTTNAVLEKAGIVIMTSKFSPPPGTSSCVALKRRKRDIGSEIMNRYSGLEKECCALGLSHDAYGRDCESRTAIVTRYLQGAHEECSRAFLQCCLSGREGGFSEMKLMRLNSAHLGRSGAGGFEEPQFISTDEESLIEEMALNKIRSDFKETWFFIDKIIGPDNVEEFQASLPHSITTWVVQAVSVSRTAGICVAEPQKIVSFKKVFVQLNLPYSIVRNEQVEIQATVFNYGNTRLGAFVYMFGVQDLCTGTQEGEKSERKRIHVEKQSAESVTFPVIPLKKGTFNIKVMALTPEGSDVVVRQLHVVPEGHLVEIDIPITLDPSNQQQRKRRHLTTETFSDSIDPSQNLQVTAIKLPIPQDFVPDTESCTITALGDRFGPTVETAINEPDKLLQLPRGCGEQNMMFMAPTLYTMRYLKVKGKISPEIEEKGYSFIRTGYANQLSFRKEDGSYAAYQNKPTSTWLTAFVVKVFCQANELVHIDGNVMCSGVKWLMDNQQPDGSFIENSPMYHLDMMGGVQGKTPLTAFALISLEECKCDAENLLISKKRALAYLEEHLGDVNEPLAVAIMAYALTLSDSVLKKAANDKLMSISKYNDDLNMLHWGAGEAGIDVEATSYALLNQLRTGDMNRANAIVNWLNTQRLQSGSFHSTQDTVVGLQALSEYAIRAQMPAMNLVSNITSSNDKNLNEVMSFHQQNAHIIQHKKVDKIGGMLFINTAGHGVGSLSVKLRYNIPHPPEKLCRFDVKVNVTDEKPVAGLAKADVAVHRNDMFEQFPEDLIRGMKGVLNATEEPPVFLGDPRNRGQRFASLMAAPKRSVRVGSRRVKRQGGRENSKVVSKIDICIRYLGDNTPGMSIVDVGIFSGFAPDEDELRKIQDDPDHLIERYEKSSKGVVFYLKTVPKKNNYCFEFHVTQQYIVGETQPSIVKVYDYSDPDALCTVFYRPGSNSPLLKTLCGRGGVCQCAEGGCPPKSPFEVIKSIQGDAEQRQALLDIACDRYNFVWKGQVTEEAKKENGFFNITFEIEEVIKEGIEPKQVIEGDIRHFLLRDNCPPLIPTVTYLIMGKDGQKYKNEQGHIWHRYLLDKSSAVHLWTKPRVAKDKDLQRVLNRVRDSLLRGGCQT